MLEAIGAKTISLKLISDFLFKKQVFLWRITFFYFVKKNLNFDIEWRNIKCGCYFYIEVFFRAQPLEEYFRLSLRQLYCFTVCGLHWIGDSCVNYCSNISSIFLSSKVYRGRYIGKQTWCKCIICREY